MTKSADEIKAVIEGAVREFVGTCDDMWRLARWMHEKADEMSSEANEAAEQARHPDYPDLK
jgi:hypothetical protein